MAILDKIKEVLANELAVEGSEVAEEAHFMDDLGADSMNMLVIYSEVERIFGVIIEDEERLAIQTVGDLVKQVESKEG